MLDLRHGRYPSKKEGVTPTWHGMMGECKAPDEDHWLYRLAEEEKPDDWDVFKQPGGLIKGANDKWKINVNAENIHNLPANYYIRGMQGKSEDWIKVNLANEYGFVASGKPVHPKFVDSVHCIDIPNFVPNDQFKIVLGFDFGRTPACAMLQETPAGGWICFDEFLAEEMSAVTFAPELARYLQKHYKGYTFTGWGDPSGANKGKGTDNVPIDIMVAAGVPCEGTANNNPLIRRAAAELPLSEIGMEGRQRIVILPKAKMMRKGLADGVCYRRVMVVGDERYADEPDKNKYSHPVEALEYALQGEGEGKGAVTPNNDDGWDKPIND